MQKNFVFVFAILVVLVVVSSANGCKVCGNPWCSAEDSHERIELSIIEPAAKRHPWKHHHESSGCGESKCSHPKCESDCCSHCGGCKAHCKESKECCKDCSHSGGCRGHCKDCKDCCPDCGGHRCHGKDSKGCHGSCPADKGVKKLECKCKVKHRHDC